MKKQWHRIAFAAILVFAALLRSWNLEGGCALVPYYYAGVRSMLQSWHNFFFNAFDPAGFLSLDKPPLAFWLQTASARMFGFSRAAVLLPQVVEGVASVALLYWLVRRRFSVAAGLLAALFLTLTPIAVAVDRSNNTESCLTLVLLLAAWAIVRAVETSRLLPLLTAAALVGVGFNVKMLVAFGVVPALTLTYVLGSSLSAAQRMGRLAAAGIALAAVALSWSVVYELTPPQDRPFVDSTRDNSMLELAVGHNFVQRFVRPADARAHAAPLTTAGQPAGLQAGRDYVSAGPLRLAASPLAAELLWVFPLAVIGGIPAWRLSNRRQRLELAMWSMWLVAYGIVFSTAGGIFHSYYLAVMAPAICTLAAIGATALWQSRETGQWGRLMLTTAIFSTGLWQAHLVEGFYNAGSIEFGKTWLVPAFVAVTGVMTAATMRRHSVVTLPAAVSALAAALALPAAWCAATSAAVFHAGFPSAHPPFETHAMRGGHNPWARLAGALEGDPKLLAFLRQGADGQAYLLAAVNARQAAPIIIATGSPVMAFGGFSGRDPILSVDDLARLVVTHQIRYVLIGDGSRTLRRVFGQDGQTPLIDWVRDNGREVDPALWRGIAARDGPGPVGDRPQTPAESVGTQLYDLEDAVNREQTLGQHSRRVKVTASAPVRRPPREGCRRQPIGLIW